MCRTLCIANQKGGVGKTTTAINLAAGLARAGQSTLLIDLDPQCNATTGLGLTPSERHPLLRSDSLRESAQSTYAENLSVIAGSRSFEDVDRLARGDLAEDLNLSDRVDQAKRGHDYLLFDCPPSLGHLTETALASADEVVMPIQCEYFAMEGLTQMIEIIRRVMQQPGAQLEFGGIVLTMYDPSLELTAEVDQEVREFFGEIVFDTVIPRDVAVSEAPSHGRAVIDHAPRTRGARAYIELCMEVIDR
jgi:chromosome partitioning protein